MTGHRLGVLLAAGLAMLGVAAGVRASIPDGAGVIHGCYQASTLHGLPTGTVRVIDPTRPGGVCANWEAPLNWNAKGPKGATGAAGPTGPRGPSDLWDVEAGGVLNAITYATIAQLALPAGSFLVTGGASLDYGAGAALYECQLVDSAGFIDSTFASNPAANMPGDVIIQHAVTLAGPDTVKFQCLSSATPSVADGGRLDAIQVGTVH